MVLLETTKNKVLTQQIFPHLCHYALQINYDAFCISYIIIISILGKEMATSQESKCQQYLDNVNGNVNVS